MLDKFLLMEGIKMFREGLCHYWLHLGLTGKGTALQFERFVNLLVRSLELKFLWLVVCHSSITKDR